MESSANTVNFYALYVHMIRKNASYIHHYEWTKNGAMSYLTCILINLTYVCRCTPSTYINIYDIYYNLQTGSVFPYICGRLTTNPCTTHYP